MTANRIVRVADECPKDFLDVRLINVGVVCLILSVFLPTCLRLCPSTFRFKIVVVILRHHPFIWSIPHYRRSQITLSENVLISLQKLLKNAQSEWNFWGNSFIWFLTTLQRILVHLLSLGATCFRLCHLFVLRTRPWSYETFQWLVLLTHATAKKEKPRSRSLTIIIKFSSVRASYRWACFRYLSQSQPCYLLIIANQRCRSYTKKCRYPTLQAQGRPCINGCFSNSSKSRQQLCDNCPFLKHSSTNE